MPRFVVHQGGLPPLSHSFEGDALVIGRADDCDLVLGDPGLSRRHAEIRRDGDRWMLSDCESLNGTVLNGRPVLEPVALRAGDRITMGGSIVVFDPPAGASPAKPPRPTARLATIGDALPALAAVGESPAFRALLDVIERIAPSSASVLVTGENGAGKEVVARLIHRRSPRAQRPLVVVNCPAIPASLLEAELFGVERGVATGVEPRAGILEAADGGTLLLDEVADMDPVAQAKVLRFLEDRSVTKVGGRTARPLDVRVLSLTNHDLEAEVERGAFRRDLFHRLNVVHVVVPPLRERREDIPLLAAHFLGGGASLHPEALARLMAHDFPGNVRELKHLLEGASLLARGGEIRPEHLPAAVRGTPRAAAQAVERPSAAPAEAPSSADRLFERIVHGGESFWEVVQKPYLRRDVSREEARGVLERAYAEAGGSYRKIARLFRMEPELKRLLNFVYNHDLQVHER